MKHYIFPLLLVVLLCFQGCCLYSDCEDDDFPGDLAYSQFEPVFLDRNALEASIQWSEAVQIENSGKIYIKDNLLFVSELRKGFHVFDNSNPENPIKISFLKIPGSTDLAMRNNVLYINQATDLVTARLNLDTKSLLVTKRVANTFPEMMSPDGFYAHNTPANSIVVDWKPKN